MDPISPQKKYSSPRLPVLIIHEIFVSFHGLSQCTPVGLSESRTRWETYLASMASPVAKPIRIV